MIYRALVKRSAGPTGGSPIHLVRDGAEASLCGLPRVTLGPVGTMDELMCPACIEWLPKRMAATSSIPRAEPSK
jgi:hypothetical protein